MATEIITDANSQLTQIRDFLGQIVEKIDNGENGLDPLGRKVHELIARVDHIDKVKSKGDKVYETGNRSYDGAIRALGDTVIEAWNRSRGRPHNDNFQRAQTEGTDSQGGVLVPDLVGDVLSRIPGEAPLAEVLGTVIPPMKSDTYKFPVSTSGPTVYYPGENTAPSESAAVFDNPTLTSKTAVAIDTFSQELTDDNLIPVAPILGQLFIEAINNSINVQTFSSASPFTGLIQEIEAASSPNYYYISGGAGNGSTNYSAIVFNDLVGLMHSVNTKCRFKGQFVMHPNVFRYVMGLKDSQNRPLFVANWATPAFDGTGTLPDQWTASPGSLLGRPLYLTDAMPTTSAVSKPFIIYGDFKRGYAFWNRQPVAIDFSKEAGFTAYATVLRATRRYAVKMLLKDCFGMLRTPAT
jgi:HK97 family phage major capsid protein